MSAAGGQGPGPRNPLPKATSSLLLAVLVAIIIAGVVGLVVRNTGASSSTAPGHGGSSSSTSTVPGTTGATTTTSSGPPPTTFAVPTTQPLQTKAVVPKCAPPGNKERLVLFTKAPPKCIQNSSVWDATFHTSVGPIVVEMDASKSYAAVNSFVFLAQWHYYDGTFFHRVITGFVVQGGDPAGTGDGGPHHYPGYSYTGNTPPHSCTTKPTAACYQPGDLAMANTGAPSSNGSQFFFVLAGGQKTLDTEPNYTDFGHVVKGTKALDQIGAWGSQAGTPVVTVYILSLTVSEVRA